MKKTVVKEFKFNRDNVIEIDMTNVDPNLLTVDFGKKIMELKKKGYQIINTATGANIDSYGYFAKLLYKKVPIK